MRPAVKRSLWIIGAACLLGVVLLGSIWLAGNTDPGRRLIERTTDRLTSGHVQLIGLGGRFPLDLTLAELRLSDEQGLWLSADGVALRWSPLDLLDRRIHVGELHVARIHMERAPVGGKGGGSVSVPHIEVERFAIDTLELGAPLVGTPAALTAQGRLQLRSLDDATADVTARRKGGEGEYGVQLRFDSKRMDAKASVREPAGGPLENLLSLPGLGALSITLSLQGPRGAERVDATIDAGPLHATMNGRIDLAHESAELAYALTAPAMTPRADLSWSRIALNGTWHGTLAAPAAHGKLEIEDLRVAGGTRLLRGSADLAANSGKLTLHSTLTGLEIPGPWPRLFADAPVKLDAVMSLADKAHPLELSASHPLATVSARADAADFGSGELRATIEIHVPEVQPFAALAGQDARGSASIKARYSHAAGGDSLGADAALGLTGGAAAWIGLVGPRAELALSADLSAAAIDVAELRLTANGATLTASGTAARAAGESAASIKSVQARWQLDVTDLSRLSGDVAGDVKSSGEITGAPDSLVIDAKVASTLSVRGSSSGSVQAQIHARGLPDAPSGTLQARGRVDGAPLNVDAEIDRRSGRPFRVTVRHADWKSAHLQGDVTSDQTLGSSHGQLHLSVGQLGDLDRLVGTHLAGSVDGNLALVPAHGRSEARLSLDGRNLAVGSVTGNMHLDAQGLAEAMGVHLTAQVPKLAGAPADLSAAGTVDLTGRRLNLESLSTTVRGETVRLLAPAQLSFANGVAVNDVKLGADGAVFELRGQLAPTFDLGASLTHAGPALVNRFAPGLLDGGSLAAQARLQGSPSSPTGNISVDASGVRFADDTATSLPALDVHAKADLADDTASLTATLSAGTDSHLTASGRVPLDAAGALDLKIGGTLDVGLVSPLLEAKGLHATGALKVDATVTGTSLAPKVGGGITLADGSLRDFGRGVNLTAINAEVVGNEAGLQIKTFRAKAASGTLELSGTFGVLQHGMPVDLKLTAKNAQPIASSIVTANLDADLHVSGTAMERVDVSGTVHVNKATIGIPDSFPPDVAVLDVRRRGAAPPAPGAKPLVVGFDVSIQAPQQILVEGRGLNAELGGEIKLGGTSEAPLASGGFDLQRGSFSIAKNTLNFTQGRVGFDGAGLRKKIDPTLDFTAQTTVTDTGGTTTVTLRITGVADAPRFEFSSSPTLPPDEIMARLLFGESAAQLSALQLAEIGVSLATLTGVGGGGSNPLTKLQKTLGLDRLSVGSNTTTSPTGAPENSGAAIAAGRYITKRVYIEGKQTTAGTSQVQVDVDLTKHLKLQTRLGNGTATTQGTTPENDPGSSVGISYQFEY